MTALRAEPMAQCSFCKQKSFKINLVYYMEGGVSYACDQCAQTDPSIQKFEDKYIFKDLNPVQVNFEKAESVSRDMFSLADTLRRLKEQKELLDVQLKECNAAIEQTNDALVKMMVDEEMPRFSRNGKTFHLSTRLFASPQEGQKETLYGWLKENGYGDLVKETVHANSLNSWVKEIKEENDGQLPGELGPMLNVFEKTSVGIRTGK